MLVRTHMQDLKDVTRETHYENYRAQCIQSMTRLVVKERNRKYGQNLRQSWQGDPKTFPCSSIGPELNLSWCWGPPNFTTLLSPSPQQTDSREWY
jgi:hypothetical protein